MSTQITHRDADGNPIFWVTGKGTHRHANYYCANTRRSVMTGDVSATRAVDSELPLCQHCCPAELLAAQPAPAPKPVTEAAEKCAGGRIEGVNMKRVAPRGACPTCGKDVAVSKKAATFRMAVPHTPAR